MDWSVLRSAILESAGLDRTLVGVAEAIPVDAVDLALHPMGTQDK